MERPMRADARRNRVRVLAAAEEVFAEAGLRAQIEDVARRAGVGVGTVCRNFPTKEALVEAVLEAMYGAVLAEAEVAEARDDPAAAFESFVYSLSDFHARHRALAESMATSIDIRAAAPSTKAALRRAVSRLLTNAQQAGAVRDDIGPADVALLFAGVANATALAGSMQPLLRQRYLKIILDGLRPDHPTSLPGKPFDFAQLDRARKRQGK